MFGTNGRAQRDTPPDDTALWDEALDAATQTPAKKDKRARRMLKFWLDANKDDDRELGQWLERLKKQRQYTPTLRNALRLYRDLQRGRWDVLRELFPELWDEDK